MRRQLINNPLLFSISVTVLVIVLLPCAVFSGEASLNNKQRIDGKTRLRIEVTAGENAEPVTKADVFVTSEVEDTDFAKTVKTNDHGVASISKVPRGKVLIQVTAAGCRNFGERYELTQENQTILIRLERDNDGGT